MSNIPPLRILRAMVLGRIGRRPLTETQQRREAEILDIATAAMARFGRNKIRFKPLAQALRICVDTLRWHFADVDEILGEIITRHLTTIQAEIAEIPPKAEDRAARLHRALKNAALTKAGTLTEAHTLLLRERHILPADVLGPIAETWASLQASLAPALPDSALRLLEDLSPLTDAVAEPAPQPVPPASAKPAATPRPSAKPAPTTYPTAAELALLAAARQPGTLQHYLASRPQKPVPR